MSPQELRAKIAKGEFSRPTAGECAGYIQTNLVVLPQVYASRFEKFAKANAKAEKKHAKAYEKFVKETTKKNEKGEKKAVVTKKGIQDV